MFELGAVETGNVVEIVPSVQEVSDTWATQSRVLLGEILDGPLFGLAVRKESLLRPTNECLSPRPKVRKHLHIRSKEAELSITQVCGMTHRRWMLPVPPQRLTDSLKMRLSYNSTCQELVILKADTVLFGEPA